jgi:His/Glu/Gln/Arg/opine family amino acid ABC transporter permease subunit
MIFDSALAFASLPQLLRGAAMTIAVTVPILLLGGLLAIPIALARLSAKRPVRALATAYVVIFRGTPSLILLYLIYSGLGHIEAVRASPLWIVLSRAYPCAVIGFTLVHSAYVVEILRGSLEAVPRGLIEAGQGLGLSPRALLWQVRLPIALRYALRSYQNEVLIIIKSTAAVSAITVVDLMAAANEVFYLTYDPFTPFIAAGMLYWVIINLVRTGFDLADRRFNAHLFAAAKQAQARRARRVFAFTAYRTSKAIP